MSWTTRELDVSCSWTLRDTRDMLRIGTHNPALSRRVHDEFTNSSRTVHDLVAKFCRDQNFEHFKILVPTWHAVTTGLRKLHASWRLVYAMTRLQSCQCVPQNRASVKLALIWGHTAPVLSYTSYSSGTLSFMMLQLWNVLPQAQTWNPTPVQYIDTVSALRCPFY